MTPSFGTDFSKAKQDVKRDQHQAVDWSSSELPANASVVQTHHFLPQQQAPSGYNSRSHQNRASGPNLLPWEQTPDYLYSQNFQAEYQPQYAAPHTDMITRRNPAFQNISPSKSQQRIHNSNKAQDSRLIKCKSLNTDDEHYVMLPSVDSHDPLHSTYFDNVAYTTTVPKSYEMSQFPGHAPRNRWSAWETSAQAQYLKNDPNAPTSFYSDPRNINNWVNSSSFHAHNLPHPNELAPFTDEYEPQMMARHPEKTERPLSFAQHGPCVAIVAPDMDSLRRILETNFPNSATLVTNQESLSRSSREHAQPPVTAPVFLEEYVDLINGRQLQSVPSVLLEKGRISEVPRVPLFKCCKLFQPLVHTTPLVQSHREEPDGCLASRVVSCDNSTSFQKLVPPKNICRNLNPALLGASNVEQEKRRSIVVRQPRKLDTAAFLETASFALPRRSVSIARELIENAEMQEDDPVKNGHSNPLKEYLQSKQQNGQRPRLQVPWADSRASPLKNVTFAETPARDLHPDSSVMSVSERAKIWQSPQVSKALRRHSHGNFTTMDHDLGIEENPPSVGDRIKLLQSGRDEPANENDTLKAPVTQMMRPPPRNAGTSLANRYLKSCQENRAPEKRAHMPGNRISK
ncbi:hypothetical protein Ciccas_003698 [Cichlidogyrus casuarinus]|uniref:Uncharacterized protein n=1 Tax=Cichlidogyrus casuarinus TaxID=1844966 RepID=A0ABD2QDM0_9PLAT